MRTALLWIFGVFPAAGWLVWSAAQAVLSLLAFANSPSYSVLYTGLGALGVWGAISIILSILGRARKHTKFGLIAALALLTIYVGSGLLIEPDVLGSIAILLGAGLIVVTVWLVIENRKSGQIQETGSAPRGD